MNKLPLIFELSTSHRKATAQCPPAIFNEAVNLPTHLLRTSKPCLPEVSELQVVRHYTKLSQQNYGIDTAFYPLGSCTMKYNPRGVQKAVSQSGWLERHPLSLVNHSQSFLQCLYELQEYLLNVTGMRGVSLTPMAGSQGEFAGVAMIKAYHDAKKDFERSEIIIPDAAHGTNPASAAMCGYKVLEFPTLNSGDADLDALDKLLSPKTAGIMLTNPSTVGTFVRNIQELSSRIHKVGGLLYYDGANLNAILGKVKPGDMGFDVIHLNLHKTFATPHGGGGPGAGPVLVNERLKPFLPIPYVIKENQEYRWATKSDCPQTIGRLSAFMGNAGILLRAYAYIRVLGKEGLERVSQYAVLNANYLQVALKKLGFRLAYPMRRAMHEFIITLQDEKKSHGVTAMDVAKRLLDYGFYAPTVYFPLLVPECFLIEPTETEAKQTLDSFIQALAQIKNEIINNPDMVKGAPYSLPIKRLDEVKAARDLNLVWKAPKFNQELANENNK